MMFLSLFNTQCAAVVIPDDDCKNSVRRQCNDCRGLLHPPPIGSAVYCDERVCLCVCLSVRDHIFEIHVRSSPNFCACYLWPWAALWQRSDMLCTSGFMDDVIFAHKPRLLDVAAQLKRTAYAALGLAINCVQ